MAADTPLDALHAAVQTFSNSLADDEDNIGVVSNALIGLARSELRPGRAAAVRHLVRGDR